MVSTLLTHLLLLSLSPLSLALSSSLFYFFSFFTDIDINRFDIEGPGLYWGSSTADNAKFFEEMLEAAKQQGKRQVERREERGERRREREREDKLMKDDRGETRHLHVEVPMGAYLWILQRRVWVPFVVCQLYIQPSFVSPSFSPFFHILSSLFLSFPSLFLFDHTHDGQESFADFSPFNGWTKPSIKVYQVILLLFFSFFLFPPTLFHSSLLLSSPLLLLLAIDFLLIPLTAIPRLSRRVRRWC